MPLESTVPLCGCPEHYKQRHCPACHGSGYILPAGSVRYCIVCSIKVDRAIELLKDSKSASVLDALKFLRAARE